MKYLEEWTLVERDHTSVLSQAIEDIKENTLNLPVTGGARVCKFLKNLITVD